MPFMMLKLIKIVKNEQAYEKELQKQNVVIMDGRSKTMRQDISLRTKQNYPEEQYRTKQMVVIAI